MNVFKKCYDIKKLPIYSHKSLIFLEYSIASMSSNKRLKNLNKINILINKISTLKKKIHHNSVRNSKKDTDRKNPSEIINTDKTSNGHRNCKENGTISIAIVGGGCATVCATILLKQNPAIKEIRLVDTDDSLTGPVCDIKQIDTSTKIMHYKRNSILDGLRNVDIVALMDETNFTISNEEPFLQFTMSADYVKNVTECMINACPNALVTVFTRPVTATLPLVSEVYKLSGIWNPNKIIGSATLELMKIAAITAIHLDLNPSLLSVPIIGGIDTLTIVPLFSRAKPFNNFTKEDEDTLMLKLKYADKYLFESETKGPILSSGVATAKLISTLINGLKKENICITSAYVRSDILPNCQYMTSELQFGPNGIQKNFGFPKISSKEICLIEQAIPVINKIVDTARLFVHTGKLQ